MAVKRHVSFALSASVSQWLIRVQYSKGILVPLPTEKVKRTAPDFAENIQDQKPKKFPLFVFCRIYPWPELLKPMISLEVNLNSYNQSLVIRFCLEKAF